MRYFQVELVKSHGGLTSAYDWSNIYTVALDASLNDARHITNMNFFVTAEKALYDPSVVIKYAVTTEIPAYKGASFERGFKRITTNQVGTRTAEGNLRSFDDVAIIERRAAVNAPGRLELRGCIYEEDVENLADGLVTLKAASGNNAAAVLGAFAGAITTGAFVGQMVVAPNPKSLVDTARPITENVIVGIRTRQTTNTTTTWEDDAESAASKLMAQTEARLRKIRAQAGFAGFTPTQIEIFLGAAANILLLLRLLPGARAARITFGALWTGITIPPLRP